MRDLIELPLSGGKTCMVRVSEIVEAEPFNGITRIHLRTWPSETYVAVACDIATLIAKIKENQAHYG